MNNMGRCMYDAEFPDILDLTPGELVLSKVLNRRGLDYLAEMGRYNIYLPFRGFFPVSQFFNSGSHRGLDWGMPNRSPLYCPLPSAKITFAGFTSEGYANNIRGIDSTQGLMFLLAHMPNSNAYNARVGDTVTWDKQLGWSDNTGNSTGPHLHMEIRLAPFAYANAIDFFGEIDDWPTTPPPPQPPPPTPPPTPIPPATPVPMPIFPALPIAIFLHDGRILRDRPSSSATKLPHIITMGQEVQVMNVIQAEGKLWAMLGYGVYACFQSGGSVYMRWK